jgi:hypothetical protein
MAGRLVLIALALAGAVFFCACEESVIGACESDRDCDPPFRCVDGVCRQPVEGGPDGGEDGGGDPGGEAGDGDPWTDRAEDGGDGDGDGDGGGDPGGDPGGDEAAPWIITPGVGVGPVTVSASMTNPTTLSQVQGVLGETGRLAQNTSYTYVFKNDTLSVTGIDTNGNQVFDGADHIISIAILEGLDARTGEGLQVGSTQAQVRAAARFSNPDRSAVLPPYQDFLGGKFDSYFRLGFYVGYDSTDTSTTMIVSRQYPRPPDGRISPAAGTLTFGGTVIQCGDGYQTGSEEDVHRVVLGLPNWRSYFMADINSPYADEVELYIDSYRVLGMEFIGGHDEIFIYSVDLLVAVAIYPFYYGQTAYGHGVGSTKAEWESELGAPVSQITDPQYGVMFVYQASTDYKFAIMYTDDGVSQDDKAVLLVLNYQEAP